jgi:hypothetical protein
MAGRPSGAPQETPQAAAVRLLPARKMSRPAGAESAEVGLLADDDEDLTHCKHARPRRTDVEAAANVAHREDDDVIVT